IKGSNMSDLWYSAKLNWEDMVTRGTRLQVERVEESSNNNSKIAPKIQLPYNWLVSTEDDVENDEVKGKEINLFNLGL
ncbi:TIR-NBS-LRR type disease resistance protein, partial [Trifolium medium]|nr:TIR-NBS-LRR type disease resistance protein [Trifolium medium]